MCALHTVHYILRLNELMILPDGSAKCYGGTVGRISTSQGSRVNPELG